MANLRFDYRNVRDVEAGPGRQPVPFMPASVHGDLTPNDPFGSFLKGAVDKFTKEMEAKRDQEFNLQQRREQSKLNVEEYSGKEAAELESMKAHVKEGFWPKEYERAQMGPLKKQALEAKVKEAIARARGKGGGGAEGALPSLVGTDGKPVVPFRDVDGRAELTPEYRKLLMERGVDKKTIDRLAATERLLNKSEGDMSEKERFLMDMVRRDIARSREYTDWQVKGFEELYGDIVRIDPRTGAPSVIDPVAFERLSPEERAAMAARGKAIRAEIQEVNTNDMKFRRSLGGEPSAPTTRTSEPANAMEEAKRFSEKYPQLKITIEPTGEPAGSAPKVTPDNYPVNIPAAPTPLNPPVPVIQPSPENPAPMTLGTPPGPTSMVPPSSRPGPFTPANPFIPPYNRRA